MSDDSLDEDERDQWFRDRMAQTSLLPLDLENAGREAWDAATRGGVDLAARTPAELRALGAREIDRRNATAGTLRTSGPSFDRHQQALKSEPTSLPSHPSQIGKPTWLSDGAWGAAMQADTAFRGAANLLTFGGADHFAAGMDALVGGGLDHWRQRYDANLAEERQRDRYDMAKRSTALSTGQIGGTALGLGLVGPADSVLAFAPRLPGAAALTGREAAAILSGGALTGVGLKVASDAARGRRSSLNDQAAAAVGGAAGAAALPLGPGRAGAVGSWVTSATQDVLDGRGVALDSAGESAILGNVIGGLGGNTASGAAGELSSGAKGRLGETLGDVRSTINGQRRVWAPKSRDYFASDDYWYPDGRSGSARFEDKFGYDAELSPNQTRAREALGSKFILYHFTPDDVGRLSSIPLLTSGAQLDGRVGAEPAPLGR